MKESNWTKYRDGWFVYQDIQSEARRWGIDFSSPGCQFQLFDNTNYNLCRTYPRWIILPRNVSLHTITESSKFRTKNRLPALSYYYSKNGCSIWRSSQCMNGMLGNRCTEDEIMIEEVGKTAENKRSLVNNSYLLILDARPYINA